ncbi:ECF RNA polymerase sigma factor SigW [Posidoniimonas polymericola]|uniref:ECF RNA polymerase sigma factor SigW n=1 Tax=Posidoniimonas polymericola TaxID=2528002 RepID=A0A5C5YQY0_9BACT|nr:RNA polymerase sigma factor [Posidoniimonas polymericola]TWT77341.1 ECF RNA polymerase sigma factor SigW [Posidoniimonas polymericola]
MPPLSRDEFTELYLAAHPKLWTVAVAVIGDRDLAEDALQDAAITGLNKVDSYERGTNFAAWMSQIVRFTSLNYLRKREKRDRTADPQHIVEATADSARGQNTTAEPVLTHASGAFDPDKLGIDDQLAAALVTLPADRRICLLLRIVQALSYDEIAEMLGIPASTAMSHVHRAKAALKSQLSANVPTEGGAA